MSSVGKWKIATYILAATTAGSLFYGRSKAIKSTSSSSPSVRDTSYQQRLSSLSRLRLPAAMSGIDEPQLLRDLKSARSIQEITLICQRLGIFGTDRALADLEELSTRRRDAAGVALAAMGGIGSDAATERLIRLAQSGRSNLRSWATKGLAKASSRRAHAQLYQWAEGESRALKLASIGALGEVRSDEALEVLVRASTSSETEIQHAVLVAAGAMATPKSAALVLAMADQGNRNLRMVALRNMPRSLSGVQEEWLMDVLTAGDPTCGALAAEALGRAQARDAVPLLVDAASGVHRELRTGAVRGLALLGGDDVQKALAELFKDARSTDAYEIGRALLNIRGDQGRQSFLAVMKKGHPARADLIGLLYDFSGSDVHALRLEILTNGNHRERGQIMNQLMDSDDPQVAGIMAQMAKTGSNSDRYTALRYLSRSSSQESRLAVMEIARGRGQASVEALRLLADGQSFDPDVQGVLYDALYSAVPSKVQTASWALANSGSEEGRAALLEALNSGNGMLANAALSAIEQIGHGPEVMEALERIATDTKNPKLKSSALFQLANGGNPESTGIVLQAISDGDSMAGGMVSVLVQRGGADARGAIDAALKSDSAQTRAALANTIAHEGGNEALPVLDTLLADGDLSVKRAAVYALGNLGSEDAGQRLLTLAQEGETSMRQAAISALGNSGDPRASGVIAEALLSGESSLAQTAIYSAHYGGPEVDEALLTLIDNGDSELFLRQQAANVLIDRGGVDPEKLKELQALVVQNGTNHFSKDFTQLRQRAH
ncbi:MAG: HEAT repeat domain-containing protein [Myxococcales bacterium]|nr:HEAT repeat domain-containing protein [Myxococcales bacterium]